MGAVHMDLNKWERHYEAMYPLDNPYGVRALFEDYHKLWGRVYDRGDYDALIVILDFMGALDSVSLTKKQREALFYVYMIGMKQEDAAKQLGYASHRAVGRLIDRAVISISINEGYDEEVLREKYEFHIQQIG